MEHAELKCTLYNASDLPERVISAWVNFRNMNAALYSPYFHPDYTSQVARLCDDVKVAVLENSADILAILPYQGDSFGRPVGAPFTDYHGIICPPDSPYSLQDMFKGTSVGAFYYDALVESTAYRGSERKKAAVIAFPQGAQAWIEGQDSSFRKHQKSLRRRIRKVTDEIGNPKFISHSSDDNVFNTLIAWKTAQYQESGYYNVLGVGWTLDLLKNFWTKDENTNLRLDMHCLYFGDHLAAIDTGLTDGKTYHSWIVAYDPQFHIYSPGTQLLNHIIKDADKLGYQRLDLGTGIEGYKKYYASEDIYTSSGFTAISGPAARLSKLYDAAERLGQKKLADAPGKLRRRYSQIAACEDTFSGRARAMLSSVASRPK